jgi:pimeloyl-ACP methyl ester carboxylesterase
MLHYSIHEHSPQSEWVTFIHGAGGSSAIWYKQIRSFKQHFNLLLIDLRGHGNSSTQQLNPLKKYTFEVIGDEVVQVIRHLNIPKTHFIGISLGTIIIRDIAERYPEICHKLILGGAIMKLNIRGQFLMRLGVLLKSILPYLILYKFFAFIIMPRKKHKESRFLFINEAKKLYQKEFIRWFKLTSQINPMLRFFRLNDSSSKTLYIMGQEDYMFLPSIQHLVQFHPNATLHIIPDCGHVVNVEKPHHFNQTVIDYLHAS